MKAFVTGGAGFIGSNLVKHLLEQGHQVTVRDNLASGYRTNIVSFPEVGFIEGDVCHTEALTKSIKGLSGA